MRKIEMYFYSTNPAPDNTGFKFVLLEILIEKPGKSPSIKYDWGFCEWLGTQWGSMGEMPEGVTAVVHRWANTVDPEVLLKEKSKILKLGE